MEPQSKFRLYAAINFVIGALLSLFIFLVGTKQLPFDFSAVDLFFLSLAAAIFILVAILTLLPERIRSKLSKKLHMPFLHSD